MAVPQNIVNEVIALNTAIVAAQPLDSQPPAVLVPLANQAIGLVNDTVTALLANAGALDTGIADTMPPAIVADFNAIVASAAAQLSLADLAGYAGRVASNLTDAA